MYHVLSSFEFHHMLSQEQLVGSFVHSVFVCSNVSMSGYLNQKYKLYQFDVKENII